MINMCLFNQSRLCNIM